MEIPRTSNKRPPFPRSQSSNEKRDVSPQAVEEDRKGKGPHFGSYGLSTLTGAENLAPPNSQKDRNSTYSQASDVSGTGKEFIPMVLDSNPAPGPSPMVRREPAPREPASPPQPEHKPNARDYFNGKNNVTRKPAREHEDSPQMPQYHDSPNISRHSSQPNSPHIAYQERGRQLSNEYADGARRKKDHHGNNSINAIANEGLRDFSGEQRQRRNGENQNNTRFMLQEVPKNKKVERRPTNDEAPSPAVDTKMPLSNSKSAPSPASTQVCEQQVVLPAHVSPASSRSDATLSGSSQDLMAVRSYGSTDSPSQSSPLATQLKNLPERGDSLAKGMPGRVQPARRETEASKLSNAIASSESDKDKPASAPPTTTTQPSLPFSATVNGKHALSRPPENAEDIVSEEAPTPPMRAKERLAFQNAIAGDSFQSPRAPPQPPSTGQRSRNDNGRSETLLDGEQPPLSAPRPVEEGAAVAGEEVSRVMGTDGIMDGPGFLRRVSSSVKHARSYSDRGGVLLSKEEKWPKSPMVGSQSPHGPDIGSPTSSSTETREEIVWYKNELRRERQRHAEKDQRLAELESALEAKNSINQMNTELKEKRSTMVILDTQKEIVIRELDVLTEHIAAAKKSNEPLDMGKLSSTVLVEFAESLQKLKDTFAPQIEDLTQRRNDLLEEITTLEQEKDKSFQELDQLSAKNMQLSELNDTLAFQIQELYKKNAGPSQDAGRPPLNALGIYTNRDRAAAVAMEQRDNRPSITESNLTGSTAVPDTEAEPAAYLNAPQVVNIRKAQPRKFNWKKGGHNVAKGVKGLKGAFSSEARAQREGSTFTEGIPYGSMSQQEYPSTQPPRALPTERKEGFGAFFSDRKQRPQQQWKNSPNGSSPAVHTESGIRKCKSLVYPPRNAKCPPSSVWFRARSPC